MDNFFHSHDIKKEYDVVILGAGPAGCSAGIYSARDDLSTIIFEKSFPGGNVSITETVENYPAFVNEISGNELSQKFYEHATRFGAEVKFGICSKIEPDGNYKIVHLEGGRQVRAKAVIIATGSRPKHMGAKGESAFIGRGISFCATCDGGFFKDKEIAVIGGGNSALEEGLYLTRFASKVTVVHRREEFRASKIIQKRAFDNPKMKFETPFTVEEVLGDERVTGLRLKNTKTNEEKIISCEGIFIFVGWDANTENFKDLIECHEDGFIKSDETTKTNIEGIFAAGDVRKKELMQIVTAASDGAIAAKMAEKYIFENFNK